MCYLLRQQPAHPETGSATPPQSLERLRPRVIGAMAAVLVAGLAMATLSGPASAPAVPQAKDPAAPFLLTGSTLPPASTADKASLPADDGVPTSADVAKAGMGNCHHGM